MERNIIVKDNSIIIKIGEFIGDLFLLQFYFFIYSLRGLIVLGIFPSFLASIKVLISKFYDKNPNTLQYEFTETYKKYFKISNIIGWIIAFFSSILIFDYNINQKFLENNLLRIILLVLMILTLIIISHLPITILRFDLEINVYFSQSLLIGLSSPFELISLLISLLLIEQIFLRYPILILLLGIPILAIPFAYFSNRSVDKIKDKRQNDG